VPRAQHRHLPSCMHAALVNSHLSLIAPCLWSHVLKPHHSPPPGPVLDSLGSQCGNVSTCRAARVPEAPCICEGGDRVSSGAASSDNAGAAEVERDMLANDGGFCVDEAGGGLRSAALDVKALSTDRRLPRSNPPRTPSVAAGTALAGVAFLVKSSVELHAGPRKLFPAFQVERRP